MLGTALQLRDKRRVNPGPLQTDRWPLVWADLDPGDLPSWVTWRRTCQQRGSDGQPCPRRWAGSYFDVRYCDKHWPSGVSTVAVTAVG